MEPIRVITSRTVVLPIDNVDTDQIIPARFLKTTSKAGLGASLFSDWRYDSSGKPTPDFPLNRAESRDARILVAGDNFGCGSSREHAPWALHDFGFRAVVSTTIADIFRSNALKNGLLTIVVDKAAHAKLVEHPGALITIDLEAQTIALPDGSKAGFPIDAFARHCLLNGIDQLGYLLSKESAIAEYEDRLRE
ncbi:MAG: 3-isopropylmalate dehydratase small subunit [Vicinamibacteria bacterium]|nr:3-isopropylmalate dehydratase small subunit [Vicinamibacteria bacterium]